MCFLLDKQKNEATNFDQSQLNKKPLSAFDQKPNDYKQEIVRPMIVPEKKHPKIFPQEDPMDNDERAFVEQVDTKQAHSFALKESIQHEAVSQLFLIVPSPDSFFVSGR